MICMAIRNAVFSFTSRARESWSADSSCLVFGMNMIEKKPLLKWQGRVARDRARRDTERGLSVVAAMAVLITGGLGRTTVRASWFAAPAGLLKMNNTIFLR